MAFAQNFNYCMEQRGYSAYRFAQIIGASNQGVLNWQAGISVPYLKTRKKIADHFGITLEALEGDALPVLPPNSKPEQKESPGPEAEGVSGADNVTAELMSLWRAASPEQKQLYLKILKAMEDEHAEK